MISWEDMTEIERLAHSIKNNTAYQNRYIEEVPSLGFGPSSVTYRETNPGLFDQARALLAIDPTPATREDRRAETMTTTRAAQQQQAQSTPLGMTNAQVASFNSLVESGKFNPDGSVNMDWFNSLSDKEAKEAWYQGINYGYGLGNTATHKAMKDSMREVYSQRFPPSNQQQDFTFGGSSTPSVTNNNVMPETATQDVAQNQNFLQLLQALGLENLFQSFQPYVARQASAMYTPPAMGGAMSTGNAGLFGLPQNFGMAPTNIGYLPPLITNPNSPVASTGMLNQVFQGILNG